MSSEHHNSNVQQSSGCKLISVFQFGATKTEVSAQIWALCHHYSHINPALPVQTLKRPAGTPRAHITSFNHFQTRFSSWLTVSSSAASCSPLRGSIMFWIQMSELMWRSPERIFVFISRVSLYVFLSPETLCCVVLWNASGPTTEIPLENNCNKCRPELHVSVFEYSVTR